MGDIKLWDDAEAVLKKILDKKYGEGNYEINEGDGAFYGPKIDLQIKDALGREWQCGTIQLDFQLPRNFELKYIAQDGSEKTPVVIHRAIFGSLERFIGIIIENFKGAFPFWMSPYQVAIVPIRPEHNDYAKKVAQRLKGLRIRVEADYSDNNMKQKIKKFKNYKDPYILVLGDKEAENETVSINMRVHRAAGFGGLIDQRKTVKYIVSKPKRRNHESGFSFSHYLVLCSGCQYVNSVCRLQHLGQEILQARVLRVGEEFVRRVLFFDNAFVDEEDAGADFSRKAHLVGDNGHGHAVVRELLHNFEHFADHFGVQGGSGLIEGVRRGPAGALLPCPPLPASYSRCAQAPA